MNQPIRGLVLLSGSASSLRYLHARDPHYGKTYRFVAAVTDVAGATGIEFAQSVNIPTKEFDYARWCAARAVSRKDLVARQEYFSELLEYADRCRADFILCSGFMLLVTKPLLSAYAGRMLNVHPALLSIKNADGSRRYRGLKVVQRAMENGDPTGSTVHILTEDTDGGPIVAESDPLPYHQSDDADVHQERMKTACDGPAYARALERLFAADWPRKEWAA